MEENKRKPPVETKHLRRLIRYRIQKKFNMYDRLYDRPESQGGTWILAKKMKIIKELPKKEIKSIILRDRPWMKNVVV